MRVPGGMRLPLFAGEHRALMLIAESFVRVILRGVAALPHASVGEPVFRLLPVVRSKGSPKKAL
jgi:hypothetical protein